MCVVCCCCRTSDALTPNTQITVLIAPFALTLDARTHASTHRMARRGGSHASVYLPAVRRGLHADTFEIARDNHGARRSRQQIRGHARWVRGAVTVCEFARWTCERDDDTVATTRHGQAEGPTRGCACARVRARVARDASGARSTRARLAGRTGDGGAAVIRAAA